MPRPTNFVAFIRNIVREQVQEAVQGLLGAVGGPKRKAKNGLDGGGGVEDRDDRRGRRVAGRVSGPSALHGEAFAANPHRSLGAGARDDRFDRPRWLTRPALRGHELACEQPAR